MRTLAFRVWNTEHKPDPQFVYWEGFDPIIPERIWCNYDHPVQQFTGLKDKNGVDIYEGDIVQYNANSSYDGVNFEVMWSHDELGWIFFSKKQKVELTNEWTPNGDRFKLLEVIGNVYENPELLG